MSNHALSQIFTPTSVALVGATEREGALGRFVYANLRAANFQGKIFAVNPKHTRVFGETCYAGLADLPEIPDLVVIATPAATVVCILRDIGDIASIGSSGAQVKQSAQSAQSAALILSAGFAEIGTEGIARAQALQVIAKQYGIRFVGPNCLGIMRPAIGFNASFANASARAGSMALISQSGAVCTAIVDWAATTEIGFSNVISLGGALDVDFGEALDFLVHDTETKSILLYIEGIHDARGFLSALRAAARVKPVVVLKAGRHATGIKAVTSHTGALAGNDAVFDAALARCGALRLMTSLQLFAAARILAEPRIAKNLRGERLAIITNGGGPGVVAADCAADHGLKLATLTAATLSVLNAALPAHWSHANPIDLIGDATPERFTRAIEAAAADASVDALLVLFCPQTVTTAEAAAAAIIAAADTVMRAHSKPVFVAMLGGASIIAARAMLAAAHVPVFLTPETAIEAFSYLTRFRAHQIFLLQSPAATEPQRLSKAECDAAVANANRIHEKVVADKRTLFTELEAKQLLAGFGLPVEMGEIATTREAAEVAAKKIGFPVVMKIHSRDISHKSDVGGVKLNLANARQVASAFDDMLEEVSRLAPTAKIAGVNIQPMLKFADAREVLIGVSNDAVFGPVIAFGTGGIAVEAVNDAALALPPLNHLLAADLISHTRVSRVLGAYRNVKSADIDALINALVRVSTITCVLPWISEVDLNPVLAHPHGVAIVDARIVISVDAKSVSADVEKPADKLTDKFADKFAEKNANKRYHHMAIFPYPIELEREITLKDGIKLQLRAIRPDDTAFERAFVESLSDTSRYYRFLHSMTALSDDMLARFTQLDYDREMALVAMTPEKFIGVARYYPNEDHDTVEFAIAIADAWQGRGLGEQLMKALIVCARDAGYRQIEGHVLPSNSGMLKLAAVIGFTISPSGDAANTIKIILAL